MGSDKRVNLHRPVSGSAPLLEGLFYMMGAFTVVTVPVYAAVIASLLSVLDKQPILAARLLIFYRCSACFASCCEIWMFFHDEGARAEKNALDHVLEDKRPNNSLGISQCSNAVRGLFGI